MKKVFLLRAFLRSLILFLFLLLISMAPAGAQEEVTPACDNTWAIKAKVLPWMLLGSGINYTFGVEYGFHKVHSVGIDLIYNDYSSEHDVYDSSKKDYTSGPRMYTVVRGLFLNYRRYLDLNHTMLQRPFEKVFNDNYLPYVGAFGRYGKSDNHAQPGYITTQVAYDEWQYSSGVLFGVVSEILDINIGPFYKTKYIRDVEMEWGSKAYHHYTTSNFGIRVGVDLFFVVKKKSAHKIAAYSNAWERENCQGRNKNVE